MQIGNAIKQASSISLLASLDGMSNRRAFTALAIAAIAALGVAALAGMFFSQYETWSEILGGIVMLLAALIWLTGISASGFLLMDQARGANIRSVADAFLGAIFTLPKLIGTVLVQVAILLVLLLCVALLLVVCKIPSVGPMLYAFVFPVCAAVSGVVLAGLLYVYTSLSLSSLWDGCTFREILARLWAITRYRLVLVILMLVMLSLLTMFTSFVLGGIAFGGIGLVSLMSASILGSGGGLSSLGLGGALQIFNGDFGNGYFGAGALGAGILMAAVMALPMMVFLKGLCHIYLQAADGLDFSEAERAIEEHTEQIRRKAEEAQQRARESIEKSREARKPPVTTTVAEQEKAKGLACPSCHGTVLDTDTFCEHCGNKLK